MPKLVRSLFRSALAILALSFVFACSTEGDDNNQTDASTGDADVTQDGEDASADAEDTSTAEFPTGGACPEDCPFFGIGGGGSQVVECEGCAQGFCASSEDGDEVCTRPCESTAACEEIGSSSECIAVGEEMACSYGDGT